MTNRALVPARGISHTPNRTALLLGSVCCSTERPELALPHWHTLLFCIKGKRWQCSPQGHGGVHLLVTLQASESNAPFAFPSHLDGSQPALHYLDSQFPLDEDLLTEFQKAHIWGRFCLAFICLKRPWNVRTQGH